MSVADGATTRDDLGDSFADLELIWLTGLARYCRAWDRRLRQRVTLKLLKPELDDLQEQRFLREAQFLAAISHPGVIPILDTVHPGDWLCHVLGPLDRDSVRLRLDRGPLPIGDVVAIAVEVALALQHLHDSGIIHRDLKPDGVWFRGSQPILADLSLARWTDVPDQSVAAGYVVGTPLYMSPEQVQSDSSVDGRSDLYSLGCILFEMLTGTPPFESADLRELLVSHASAPRPRPRTHRIDTPRDLDDAVVTLMAPRPADRYQSTADAVAVLKSIHVA